MLEFILKRVIWLGDSKRRVQSFPEITKDILGEEIGLVQKGKNPRDWKPMPEIGFGVKEIRAHNPDEYRVLYVAKYPEAIYILNAFQKTGDKTSQKDKELGRKRYADLQKLRKTQGY